MERFDLEQVALQANQLLKLSQRLLSQRLKEDGLSSMHANYLGQLRLAGEQGRTQKELTEVLGVDKANTARVVADLLRKGYAQRQSGVSRGGRITLTPAGQQISEKVYAFIRELSDSTLMQIPPDEVENFCRTLDKLMNLLTRNLQGQWMQEDETNEE